MLQLETGLSRRGFLQGSIGFGAFMLPQAARSLDARRPVRRAKSVIVLLLEGGMSHFESWDPKPDAPTEVRGSFQSIKTPVCVNGSPNNIV